MKYKLNEIFYSIQGEGVRTGTPAIFIRFAGCNVGCTIDRQGFDCDTDHSCQLRMSAKEILDHILSLMGDCAAVPKIIFTGGEPGLQLDYKLIEVCSGHHLAIETNGSKVLPAGLDWITVSPKRGVPVVLERCDELKYVLAAGESPDHTIIEAEHHLVSPVFDGWDVDGASLRWCVEWAKKDPRWRLSVQMHKLIGVR